MLFVVKSNNVVGNDLILRENIHPRIQLQSEDHEYEEDEKKNVEKKNFAAEVPTLPSTLGHLSETCNMLCLCR